MNVYATGREPGGRKGWGDLRADLRTSARTTGTAEGGVQKSAHPKRVLVIEDNIDAARTMAYLVGDMGHTVQYAINGYVGVEMARKFLPHVVLLDIGLPGMDGFEVCSRIKSEPSLKDTRVIVITGYAQDEHRVRSMAAGCEVHLIKPVPTRVIEELLG